uniref:SMB domain-containing protein n=1 Tax=Steinernema glaseri TaxID=37863 RepID=A0A1I8A6A3_9BILA
MTSLLVLSAVLWAGAWARGFEGIPGDYCSTRSPTCCPNRDDDCTVAILGDHLCYCDMFCDRNGEGNDCCPDFKAVCRPEPETRTRECIHDGVLHHEHDKIRRNCQTCTCLGHEWRCEEEACLIQEDLLEKVRDGRFSWTARNYSAFWGRSLEDGIRYRLGTLFPEKSVQNMNEILVKPRELPARFDAREKWPGWIQGVRDQGDCASSWAVSTTSTSSDRLAIITDGRVLTATSPQQLLSCNQHRQRGCEGGYLDRAWWYIRKLGVVSDECYPYRSGATREPETCLIPKSSYRNGLHQACPAGEAVDRTVHKMTPPYRVSSREEDIMSEIVTNGPVQATFLVHEDFFMYAGGVYRHSELAQAKGYGFTAQGYHSVRIIGREEDIMSEIVTNGPVQATFLVHEDFFMYAGGVYRHSELAQAKGYGFTAQGYHSVRIIG